MPRVSGNGRGGVYRNMLRRRILAVVLILAVPIIAGSLYLWSDRIPWIEMAVHIRAERNSIDCGNVNGSEHAPTYAINCAVAAHKSHHAFFVIFYVPGVDEAISNAIVEDSRGHAMEIIYATGMVTPKGLLRHPCAEPVEF